MSYRSRVSSPRMLEIDAIAKTTRKAALAKAREIFLIEPTIIDLVQLTVGLVIPRPNLTYESKRLAGFLDCRGEAPEISYEEYDPVGRQHFSIAHECGHFVLHHVLASGYAHACPQSVIDPVEEDGEGNLREMSEADREAEADAFAAAFLMPREEFEASVQHYGFSARFHAFRFQVSGPALVRRWEWLRTCAQ